jgi:excisionase family DNA binding protein
MPSNDRPDWYTIKDAAAYLEIGEPTLYRWMREKKITFRKVGDSTRFLQEDLDAMVRVFPSERDAQTALHLCPYCNHDGIVDGGVQSTGKIYFRPRETKFWTFRDGNVEMSAKMCPQCGGVCLVGDTHKLKALRKEKSEK